MREPKREVGIENRARMLALVGVAVAIPVENAAAQAPADVEIRAAIVTEDLEVHFLPQVPFTIVSSGEPPLEFTTDLYGVYTTTLPPGNYTVKSEEDVEFLGSTYAWNVPFTVDADGVVLELTQENATTGAKKGPGVPLTPDRPGPRGPEVQARRFPNLAGQVVPGRLPSPPEPATRAVSGWWDERIGVNAIDFPGKPIARLPLPAGSYVITAKMEVFSHVDTNGSVGCRLIAGGDTDQARETWGKPADNRAPLSAFNPYTIALNVVHTFTSANSVILQCWGRTARPSDKAEYPFGVENIKITAIEVGELTNEPLDLIE